ncbi:interleukin enhancer-binding factor 3 isoform X2 [Bradysia coprophila]|uniref:interleukin enhancer-binding factor 3 isoform X2 n=1 Tax=Bradysia coprophila TaxID=38358 RepID=UPI00187D99BB|nr:interleukin enhancer-binding factor 3 isoform X2 [Bradysia coprophila]
MKIFFLLLAIIATAIQLTHSATLRRKPKVYNALITTDQNLTPSRAFPVIQPHLQETYAYPSYSYRSYSPLGLYNNGFQYGSAAASYNGFHHSYPRINPGIVQGRNFFSRDEIHSTLPPISNDFGLPSLVPINSFAFGNLAPYPYHSYPIIGSVYDHFGGHGGYLPPFPFYPPGFDGINPDNGKKDAVDKKDGNVPADGGVGDGDSSLSNSNGPSGSGGDSGSSGSGGDSGSSGSSSGSSGSNSGSSSSGGSSNASSGGGSSSSSTSSSTKSSRSRNFDRPEYPHQQSLSENIKNFPNKDPTIPDIDPSPPVRVKALNK